MLCATTIPMLGHCMGGEGLKGSVRTWGEPNCGVLRAAKRKGVAVERVWASKESEDGSPPGGRTEEAQLSSLGMVPTRLDL